VGQVDAIVVWLGLAGEVFQETPCLSYDENYVIYNNYITMRSLNTSQAAPMKIPRPKLGRSIAGLCVGLGLSRLLRVWRIHEACVLTFHSLHAGADANPGILDFGGHTCTSLFDRLCKHLGENYDVVHLSDIAKPNRNPLRRRVAITFDDGYESNYLLAAPILKKYGLPATVFLTTGFLDQEHMPWFIRYEHALGYTSADEIDISGQIFPLRSPTEKLNAYWFACGLYKAQKTQPAEALIDGLVSQLGVDPKFANLDPCIRPMSWAMARELQAGGLISLGGHTHTHPILSLCSPHHSAFEVRTCARRMAQELGHRERDFAYPNGRLTDFNEETIHQLSEARFTAAYTMQEGFVSNDSKTYAMPRYGSPEDGTYLEAVTSGTAKLLRAIKHRMSPPQQQRTGNEEALA
jgi:peptidoglycan/xylan/chitin deacetylase (PgdA/CDA1 family)